MTLKIEDVERVTNVIGLVIPTVGAVGSLVAGLVRWVQAQRAGGIEPSAEELASEAARRAVSLRIVDQADAELAITQAIIAGHLR